MPEYSFEGQQCLDEYANKENYFFVYIYYKI